MDPAKIKCLNDFDSTATLELFNRSRAISEVMQEVVQKLEDSFLHKQLQEVIEDHYDLGVVKEVWEVFGGYVNRSFGVLAEKDDKEEIYFVRKYKKDIQEKEIQLEHALITSARENGLGIAAAIFPTKDGNTYVKVVEKLGENVRDQYFAVYEYLRGEDKYTWVENELTDKEYASSAEVIATFHNALRNFTPPAGAERVEPPILQLVKELPDTFKQWAELDVNNILQSYYRENLPHIIEVNNSIIIPEEDLKDMPFIPVHCDYHPGNLKFENEKVVGIFDFDWSKMDIRLFEIGLSIAYFCANWKGELDGTLRLEQSKIFLEAYQEKLKELGGLAPLSATELKYLPLMINAGNIYLIFWCLRSYYDDLSLNVYEYFFYLQHQVKCMNWVEAHTEEILNIAKALS